jgi:hypothetical protein
MQSQSKTVILGLTNSGKSSVATLLQERGWPVFEVDDEAMRRNSGIWPEDEAVLDTLFKEINEQVLGFEKVVFVTSFLEVVDIERFTLAGFTILEMHASYEELRRRKIQRDGYPRDNWERFNRNYDNYQVIMQTMKSHIALSIDSTKRSSKSIADEVELALSG